MKMLLTFVWIGLGLSDVIAQSLKTDYAFRKYLLENVRYPEAAIQQSVSDRAYAFFEVGTDGKVTKVEVASGHRNVGFEQTIEQTLLGAPTQTKSATGKYLVEVEFYLLFPNGTSNSSEKTDVSKLAIPEGTVKLNTVKIEATAPVKSKASATQRTMGSEPNQTTTNKPPTRQQSDALAKLLPGGTMPEAAKEQKTNGNEGLTYTMRKVEREHPIKSKKTDKELGTVFVSYEYPVFNNERLNTILRKKFIKEVSFEAAAEAYIAEGKNDYADYNEEYIPASGLGQSYDFDLKVIRQTARFLFFKTYSSSYSAGAAHNLYGETYPIYVLSSLHLIQLDDIFTSSGRYELRQIAERVFRRDEKLSPTASLCNNYLFDKCRFELAENFTVTENALEFIYNPYEGKSFAAGVWSVKIPYSLIKHLVKPEYGALFGQTAKEVAAPPKATDMTPRTNNKLSYLKEYQDQYPSQVGLFVNEELPQRMKKLMGEPSFAKFVSYFQKEKPIQFYNGLAFLTGCKQNDCERYESVIFINTGLDKVYIGLLDNDQVQAWSDHPTFKSYDPTSMPADFKAWFLDASGKARGRRKNDSDKFEAGAALLFKNPQSPFANKSVEPKLTTSEKNEIYRLLEFKVFDDEQFILSKSCEEEPFSATVFVEDLNKDGIEEIQVIYGNLCTSGMTGRDVTLFIKDASGKYRKNLGFEGCGFTTLPTKNLGFPDLEICGRGFCFPVWRWNGKEYQFNRRSCK